MKSDNTLPEEISEVTYIDNPPPIDDDISNLEEAIISALENQDNIVNDFAPFNSDISHTFSERELEKIATYIKDVTEEDIKSRQPWLDIINKIKPYLGFSLEDTTNKINMLGASDEMKDLIKTFDTTFSTALLRLWALVRSEILPSEGPCGFKTDVDNSEDFELQGELTKDAINNYLTNEDKGFYQDYERFLLYLLLYGCVCRKVYQDPVTNKPISRFIIPEDFLVDNNCSSIVESNRITHIRYLNKRDILINIKQGTFRDVELNYLTNNNFTVDDYDEAEIGNNSSNIDNSVYSTLSRFKFYETHEYLDLNDFRNSNESDEENIPSPYVITRCGQTNKIVSIVPNWVEDDPVRTRINCFIHYNLFPGFDMYGLGLAQILGGNAISLTAMQRMAIDAAAYQNIPAGVKSPGVKDQNNNISIMPGQFPTVDTGGIPLRDAFMPLPFNGPSPALLEYLNRVTGQTQQLAATTEMGISENNQNTPVGTTMAMLEIANRMQSAILRTIHNSFSNEIQLIYHTLYPGWDDDNTIKITPVSDPSVESTTQRIMKAESLLKIASGAPELHNMKVIYTKVYQALGVSDIDQILAPDQPPQQEEVPIDPALQVQMADIEQRRLEVESRERIAHLNIEADGYKTQMNIELDKAKMEQDRYLADLKINLEQVLNKSKLEMDALRMEQEFNKNNDETIRKQMETETKSEIELLKIEAKERENELKAEIEILKEQLKNKNEDVYVS